MISIKNYVRAQSIEQAYDLNQNRRNRVIGGMLWLKTSNASVNTAIDLSDLGLDTIEETPEGFSIGAMASLRSLETHAGLNAFTCGAVREALKDIVGVQFRNMATIGGSIYGRFGFSDVLTLFLALDTQVELHHAGLLPLQEFAAMKRDRDILIRIHVKRHNGGCAYQSMRNARTDFPTLTCAAAKIEDEYRISIGARPGRAMLLRDDGGLLAAGITPKSAAAFAAETAKRIPTGGNMRAGAEYRSRLIRVLAERALLELEEKIHGN